MPAGKITAIIGPNGAGKTTFFNLVSGFYKPTAGRIVFEGEDVTRPARRTAWRVAASPGRSRRRSSFPRRP